MGACSSCLSCAEKGRGTIISRAQRPQTASLERLYRELVENALDLIWLLDPAGKFVFTSPSTTRLLGHAAQFMIGRAVLEFIHKDDRAAVQDAVASALAGPDQATTAEGRFRHADGSWRVLAGTGKLLPEDVEPGGIVVNLRDVTEQQATERALRAAQRSFRDLAEAVPDWLWQIDESMKFTYASPRVRELLGYEPAEIIGRTPFDFLSPEEAERVRACTARALTAHEPIQLLENTLLHKDGHPVTIETSALPFNDEDGTFRGYRGVDRDITERKRVEIELRTANRLLKIIRKCNATLVRADNETELLNDICRLIVEDGDYPLAWVGFTTEGPDNKIEVAAFHGSASSFLDGATFRLFGDGASKGPSAEAVRTGQPQVFQRMGSSSLTSDWLKKARDHGLEATAALPLRDRDDVFGVLTTYSDMQNAFGEQEVSLLTELAGDLAFGVTSIRHRILRAQAEAEQQEQEHKREIALMQTIEAIARAAESRDPYTAGHEREVARLAEAMAMEMGLSEHECEGIRVAGLLHDIGKLQVPMEILARPTRLSAPEYEVVKTHVEIGYGILTGIDFPWPVADMMRQHHERLDGSGYPLGLKDQDLIVGGRILAVADTIEAMGNHRPYRPSKGVDGALLHVLQERGKLYCPTVVDACLTLFKEKGYKLLSE